MADYCVVVGAAMGDFLDEFGRHRRVWVVLGWKWLGGCRDLGWSLQGTSKVERVGRVAGD